MGLKIWNKCVSPAGHVLSTSHLQRFLPGLDAFLGISIRIQNEEEIQVKRGELWLTYLMQVDKRLLQPGCEQSGPLRSLAFVKKPQQRRRLVEATL